MPDMLHTPNLVGHTIAQRYELQQIIGRGGHGLVFRALDRLTGEVVAVKMLTDSAAQDPGLVERLKREQRALVELAGTSAVRVYDLCASAAGKLCLVMELLDGRDLEQRLEDLEHRGERLTPEELVLVLSPIVDTLERAHAAGILHRDLKPANVFLVSPNAGGGVRLLDFGLARMQEANPLTAAGTIVGSPSYIAPEVWKGRTDQLDRRVDVYSLGVIVFRALANRLPFEVESLRDKFILATTAERPSLCALRPGLPPDMDLWIQQVLAIDRDARFDSVRAAFSALLVALGVPSPHAAEPRLAADGPVESSRIVSVGAPEPVAAEKSVFAASMPERSLVSEWLAKSAMDVEGGAPPEQEDVEHDFEPKTAPGLFDPTTPPAGERSLVSEWLLKSDIAVEHPPEPPPEEKKRQAKAGAAKKKKKTVKKKPAAKKKPAKKKPAAKKKAAKKKTAKKKKKTVKKKPAAKKVAKKKPAAKRKKAKKPAPEK
jgi:serine/threonine-protein kinase